MRPAVDNQAHPLRKHCYDCEESKIIGYDAPPEEALEVTHLEQNVCAECGEVLVEEEDGYGEYHVGGEWRKVVLGLLDRVRMWLWGRMPQ